MVTSWDLAEIVNEMDLPDGVGWLVLDSTEDDRHNLLLIEDEDDSWLIFLAHGLPCGRRIVSDICVAKHMRKDEAVEQIRLGLADLLRQIAEERLRWN